MLGFNTLYDRFLQLGLLCHIGLKVISYDSIVQITRKRQILVNKTNEITYKSIQGVRLNSLPYTKFSTYSLKIKYKIFTGKHSNESMTYLILELEREERWC